MGPILDSPSTTREQRLKFCKVCKNQKFDPNLGLICGLTDRLADFEVSCINYSEDFVLKARETAIQEKQVAINTAGMGKRLANYILDLIFYLIFVMIFGFILGIFLAILAPESLAFLDDDSSLVNYLIAMTAGVIYYSSLEFWTGRTIAKYITGTKVVDEHGEKPSYGTILVRTLCRFIPFDAFSFLGSDASGWHDKLSKTRVVNV